MNNKVKAGAVFALETIVVENNNKKYVYCFIEVTGN